MLKRIETGRLLLREIEAGDAGDIYSYASDPDVARYTSWERHTSMEDTLFFINMALDNYLDGEWYDWAIVLKESNKLIGTCGYPDYRKGTPSANIGYVLAKDYWNRGIATEVVKELISFGQNDLGLVRIQAMCMIDNIASERVMQKAGMSYEGILHKRLFKYGKYHDVKLYSIADC